MRTNATDRTMRRWGAVREASTLILWRAAMPQDRTSYNLSTGGTD